MSSAGDGPDRRRPAPPTAAELESAARVTGPDDPDVVRAQQHWRALAPSAYARLLDARSEDGPDESL